MGSLGAMLREAATSTPARLVMETVLAGAEPAVVTDHLTDPELVVTWWPVQATIDDATGDYEFSWPDQESTLRGRFTTRDRGRRVRFTWHWDHEPLHPVRTVLVTTGAVEGGTHLTITHGDYGPDDDEERRSHLEGWTHFVGRLTEQIT